VAVARDLVALGFSVVATKGTAAAIAAAGMPVKVVNKVKDGRPHIVDMIKAGEIQLVFTTVDETRTAIADSRAHPHRRAGQPRHLLHHHGRLPRRPPRR
jgi:carbamoyl-phosphate synthase large subunit